MKIGFHSVFTNSVLLQTYTCVPVFCTLNTGQDPDEIKYRWDARWKNVLIEINVQEQ